MQIKGKINYYYIMDKDNNFLFPDGKLYTEWKPKGYFQTYEDAENAIKNFSSYPLDGTQYTVGILPSMGPLVEAKLKDLNISCNNTSKNAKSFDLFYHNNKYTAKFYFTGPDVDKKRLSIEDFLRLKYSSIQFSVGNSSLTLRNNHLIIGDISLDAIELKEKLCQYVKS